MEEKIIHYGIRGEQFENFIKSLVKRGKLIQKYVDILSNDESMKLYSQAFITSEVNENENYEYFEQLGDSTFGKFIVWYSYRRFPQLLCPSGVKIVARLKINYGARKSLFDIGERLGFWNYITATEEEYSTKKKSLIEDCFEAFCGVTEYIIDKITRNGVGYAIVYDILSNIFDDIPISLRYEDLYDAKTRLKEIFDKNKQFGKLEYMNSKVDRITTTQLFMISQTGQRNQIGLGSAAKQADAEEKAASEGIKYMKRLGIESVIPKEYLTFCE
jgi:dsRNA-specific ribonuclease